MTSLRVFLGLGGVLCALGMVQGCSCATDSGTGIPRPDGGRGEGGPGGSDSGTECTTASECGTPPCPSGGAYSCDMGRCVLACDDCDDGDGDGYGTGTGCIGADCDDDDPAVSPAATETCNGTDDDCNGMDDDGLGSSTCGTGACTVTVMNCAAGVPQTCTPGTPAAMETCGDGIDDDCNGTPDDTCVCTDGTTQPCWSGDPALRGVGACVEGTQTCTGGTWAACLGEGAPGAETCNTIDDDCNGTVDDGATMACYSGPPATRGVGACTDGAQACGGGACMGEVTPVAEICNGLDDDCDGMVDDGFGSTTCGTGPCTVTVMTCIGGVPQTCSPLAGMPETCNGIDDDCNGAVDDGTGTTTCYTGPAGTSGVGACRDGAIFCTGGAMGMCTGEVTPTAEACDGVDNDCDAMTDEGLGRFSCGVGACQRSVAACAMGMTGTCVPGTPVAEVCGNAMDDNCNGTVDDGCGCVHVSPRGSDTTGLGTAARPLRTITAGIALAQTGVGFPPMVCVGGTTSCGGMAATTDYPERVVMVDGVSVFGGYEDGGIGSTSWSRRGGCTTRILDQNDVGVYFGHSITSPTAIDGFTINAHNDPTNAAITVEGSTGAIINNDVINGGTGTTSRGVNVLDGGGIAATPQITSNAISGGTGSALSIGVRSVRSAPVITGHCNVRDAAGRCQSWGCYMSTRFIRGRSNAAGTSTEVYGVRLEESPGALIADNGICGSASSGSGAGVRLSGDGTGTVVRANNLEAGGLTRNAVGFWATDCDDAAPWVVDNWQVGASCGMLGCRADGVRAVGACHPVVDSNRIVVGGEESSNNDANGVYCARDPLSGDSSRCLVIGNQQVRGSSFGMPPSATGVRCDDGACAMIARNGLITGWAGQTAIGIVLGATDTMVDDNVIDAGCATMSGAGIVATNAYARIQNNVIAGSAQQMCTRLMRMTTPTRAGPSWGVRLVLAGRNEVDLHSNSIFGGGGPSLAAMCTSRGIGIDAAPGGVPPGPRGVIRNNLVEAGQCNTRYGIEESSAAADPRILENDDLFGLGMAPTALYRDEATTDLTMIAAVNGLADISAANNISADPMLSMTLHIPAGSPCVDTGTAAGAPAEDFDGEARPGLTGFDIGADEYRP